MLLLLAAGCAVLLPRLGSVGFWDPWEPKYAESAREMVDHGSYFIPLYRDEVRLTKPILVYWGILAGAAVCGLDELGARVGGVTAGLATLLVVYYTLSRLRGRRAGLLAGLVLCSSPLFYFLARQATPDIYLLTSLGAALTLFALAHFDPSGRRRWLTYALSYACFALAVLAKGPVVAGAVYFGTLGLYAWVRLELPASWRLVDRVERRRLVLQVAVAALLFPACGVALAGIRGTALASAPKLGLSVLAATAALVTARRLLSGARRTAPLDVSSAVAAAARRFGMHALLFCGALAVVAGPWHVAVALSSQEGYVSAFLLRHNVTRFTTEINSSGISDFYLRTLIFGVFPWSCFLPLAWTTLVPRREGAGARDSGLETFWLLAAAVTIVAFSLALTKFHHYVAPILVPGAVLTGILLDRWLDERELPRTRIGAVAAFLCFLPPMVDLLRGDNVKYLISVFTVKRFVPEASAPGPAFSALLVAGAATLGLFTLRRSRFALGAFVACALGFSVYNTAVLVPRLDPHKTMKHLCRSWREDRRADAPIGFYGSIKHGIFFYTGAEVTLFERAAEVLEYMAAGDPAYLIVERERLPALEHDLARVAGGKRLRAVDESHFDFVLVANDGADARGAPRLEEPLDGDAGEPRTDDDE